MKKIGCILGLLLLVGLTACSNSVGTEVPTGDATTVEAPAELPTDTSEQATAETQVEVPSEAPTEEVTEPVTDDETVPDTGYPVDKMTIGGVDIHSFTLVVQTDGLECIRMAADELILYMEKATGYVIPEKASDYEIVIGMTDRDTVAVQDARAQVTEDGYVLLMDGNRLYITGSHDRGTMYGVYSFLEDYLGVRFLAKDCTVVRDNPIVTIPSNVYTLHNPTFIYRDVYWYDMIHDQTYTVGETIMLTINGLTTDEIAFYPVGHTPGEDASIKWGAFEDSSEPAANKMSSDCTVNLFDIPAADHSYANYLHR